MKVLFLAPWPVEAASTRLRLVQYFPYLREHGIEPVLRPFMSESFYRFVYQPGHVARKSAHFALCLARRMADVMYAAGCDLVVVHREAFPFGTTLVERLVAQAGVPIVFDFDDAIYLANNSHANGLVSRLKRPNKVSSLLRLSRAVIAGNNQLGAYSAQFNADVSVIPTPVDSEKFRPRQAPNRERVVIGWVGSPTTARYLEPVIEPLCRLAKTYPQVEVQILGGRDACMDRLPAKHVGWSLDTEVQALQQFDIGLMPYPDDEWARGKCAHKALLYMSVGIPAVCSPVGMAKEIIVEGETGFLADAPEAWFLALSRLVESAALRRQVGMQGRALVEAEFDVKVQAPRLLAVLGAAADRQPVTALYGSSDKA